MDLLSDSLNSRNESSSDSDGLSSQAPSVRAGALVWLGVRWVFSEAEVKYSDFIVDKLINRIFGLFARIPGLKRRSSQAGGVFTFRFRRDAGESSAKRRHPPQRGDELFILMV